MRGPRKPVETKQERRRSVLSQVHAAALVLTEKAAGYV